jgi:hypothetical protein
LVPTAVRGGVRRASSLPHDASQHVIAHRQINRLAKFAAGLPRRLPKPYDRKTPITAADLLNDRVVPFFDEKDGSDFGVRVRFG